MAKALKARVAVRALSLTTASGEEIECRETKLVIAYWRPGGKNMGETYWYSGVLAAVYKIRTASSYEFEVAAVN